MKTQKQAGSGLSLRFLAQRSSSSTRIGILVLVTLLVSAPSFAQESTWTGTSGSWGEPGNWDPANVPDAPGESALIPATDGCTIALDRNLNLDRMRFLCSNSTLLLGGYSLQPRSSEGIVNRGRFIANGNASFSGILRNEAGASIVVNRDQDLALFTSTLVNNGEILINDAGISNAALDILTHVAIAGTGAIVLNGDDWNDRIYGYYGHSLTQEAGHTIRGSGSVQLPLTNHGTVDADRNGLSLGLTGSSKSNDGVIRASNGGTLVVAGCTVDNTNGLIAAEGGTVSFSGMILGGELDGNSGSTFISENGWMGDAWLHEDAWVDVPSGYNLYLTLGPGGGTLTNDGTIRVNREGTGNVTLDLRDHISLVGDGEILMNGDDWNDVLYAYYGHGLTQGADHTIRGSGAVQVALTNHGTVEADHSGFSLALNGNNKTNDGHMRASNGGALYISSMITNTGGRIAAEGGTVVLAGTVVGGSLGSAPGSIIESQNGWIANVTLDQGAWVDVPSGYNLYFNTGPLGGTITNNGIIRLNREGTGNSTLDIRDHVALEGTGEIVMNGDDWNDILYAYYGHALTQGTEHTIRGSGAVQIALTNFGTVDADRNGYSMGLNGNHKTNRGVMRASNGGSLVVSAITLDNTGGTVAAQGGTVFLQDHGTILGGTFDGAPGSAFVARYGWMGDITTTSTTQLDIPTGYGLYLRGGLVANNGTIRINREGTGDAFLDVRESATIGGSGSVFLHGNDNNDCIYAYYGHTLVQNAPHRIHGSGAVYCPLVNRGTVAADSSSHVLYLHSPYFLNDGTVEAANGGVVQVNNRPANHTFASGTLAGGSWIARAASQVVLNDCSIDSIQATVVLDGAGSRISRDYSGTDALAGLVRIGTNGRFQIDHGRNFSTAAGLDVMGSLAVGATSTCTVPGSITQRHGRIAVDGSLVTPQPLTNDHGWLMGSGTIATDVTNDGRLAPGTPQGAPIPGMPPVLAVVSAGLLTIDGNFAQTAAGRMLFEIGGKDTDEFDRLHVTGTVTLGGVLEVTAVDGFVLEPGDEFAILTCASRTGQFAQVYACMEPGICLVPRYEANRVVLVAERLESTDVPDPSDPDDQGGTTDPSTPDDSETMPTSVRFYASDNGGVSRLHLELPEAAAVKLEVFDLSGRRISRLVDATETAGYHEYTWDRDGGSRGLYFARIEIRNDDLALTRTVRILQLR